MMKYGKLRYSNVDVCALVTSVELYTLITWPMLQL